LGVALIVSLLSTIHNNNSTSNDKFVVPDQAADCFEALIGIFLIVIGVHGLIRARQKRGQRILQVVKLLSTDEEDQRIDMDTECSRISIKTTDYGSCDVSNKNDCRFVKTNKLSISSLSSEYVVKICNLINCHDHSQAHHHDNSVHNTVQESSSSCTTEDDSVDENDTTTIDEERHNHHHRCTGHKDVSSSSMTTQIMAFGTGIIHGLAGPGGVLGVLPAIQLHNVRLATLYLSCFCISSIITMGLFAIVYAHFSHSIANTPNRAYIVEVVSAWFSVLVGILWLVLLYQGTLDSIFD
jgi:hypothetical protein